MVTFRLEQADGTPADPPSITLAVPSMRVGDTIPLRRGEAFRVVGVVAGDDPTLIVESDTSPTGAA
jgi:hypothetical protein